MFSQILFTSLLGLTAQIYATPTPQAYPYECSTLTGWTGIVQTVAWQKGDDPKYGWQMVPTEPVTSDEEDPASLTASYSEGISVTVTEGLSIGFNMPDEAGDFGYDFSVAFSTFTIDGYSETEPCPQGSPNAYVCGLSGLPWMVTVSGTQTEIYASNGNCLDPGAPVPGAKTFPFSFNAPVTLPAVVSGAPDGKDHAYLQYSACYCEDSQNKTYMSGLGPCPALGCAGV